MEERSTNQRRQDATAGGPSTRNEQNDSEITGQGTSSGLQGTAFDSTSNGSNGGGANSDRSSSRNRKRRKKVAGLAQRYKTTGQLGQGGWGVVEQAIDKQLQRPVAIKRMFADNVSQEVLDRFLHEAKITSQLQHPGIVPIHELESGQTTGDIFYVMKLLTGNPYRQLIRDTHAELDESNRGPRSLRESVLPLLERFVDICDAIAFAHEQGVIHRDLKPDNVMIGGFGETIVVDWGLAKRLWNSEEEPDYETINRHLEQMTEAVSGADSTMDGSVIGSPAYMPPEQAEGDLASLSPASDVYSLGATLYEVLVGKHPHPVSDVNLVLKRVREGIRIEAREAKQGVPRALSAICEKAMAFDPADRYPNAGELAADVRRYIAGDAVVADRENLFDKVARWCRRHRNIAFSASAITFSALLISSVAGIMIGKAHQAEQAAHLQTQAAYKETMERLEQSRCAADAWLIELSGALEFYPGLQPVREELIQRAASHYEDLLVTELVSNGTANSDAVTKPLVSSDSMINFQMTLERAKVSLRLGDLLRLSGENENASKHFEAAENYLKDFLEMSVAIDEASRDEINLQLSNVVVGKLLLGKTKIEDVSKHEGWLDQKLAKIDRPAQTDFEFDLASCRTRLALAKSRSQIALADASAESETAVRWSTFLVDSRGTFADLQKLQISISDWAEALNRLGEADKSTKAWNQLVEHLELIHKRSPSRIDYLQSLAYSRLRFADALAQSRREEAGARMKSQAQYELAISDFQRAWNLADADGFYQRNLATAENNLGLLLAQGAPTQRNEAELHLANSVEIRRSLIRQHPSVEEIRLFCQTLERLANLKGDDDQANKLNLLNQAISGYELIRKHGGLNDLDEKSLAILIGTRLSILDNTDDAEAPTNNADAFSSR